MTNAAMASLDFINFRLQYTPNKKPHRTQRAKTPNLKTPTLLSSNSLSTSPSSSTSSSKLKSHDYHYHHCKTPENAHSTKHITHLVETFHEHQRLKNLLRKLYKRDSSPVQILKHEGDWSKDEFWTVIKFLKESSRAKEIHQVFDMWSNIEKSRINEVNYEKILELLVEEGLIEKVLCMVQEMKDLGLNVSSKVYNYVIHGLADEGKFGEALVFLKEMREMNLKLQTKTYNGLIQAYAKHGKYGEMSKCVKKMELSGCSPDSFTYNLLTIGFARGRLLTNMDRMHQTLLSKRMLVQSSTLVAMLEAYADVGLVEKMEYIYRKVVFSKARLKEDLFRKMASVYIQNYMYSRLDEFGAGIASRSRYIDLVWCLRLLSHGCLLSRKGMESIIRDMEGAQYPWSITVVNTMALAYLKMKDFKQLDVLLSQLVTRNLKPDMVTIGVLFDANVVGFDGTWIFREWRRMGLLGREVEMETDPLVLAAFRKGSFLRRCEEVFSKLESNAAEKSVWTYSDLIDMVFKHREEKVQVVGSVEKEA
ncbi:hypothetical protein Sjap_009103 [Stephania japonica]|uniref:Pentatricopeptide repeat-containing protein n=1 Tax=Stephania japonica TaxID=461633 RepID=A0AAP0JRB6_9MAGN